MVAATGIEPLTNSYESLVKLVKLEYEPLASESAFYRV